MAVKHGSWLSLKITCKWKDTSSLTGLYCSTVQENMLWGKDFLTPYIHVTEQKLLYKETHTHTDTHTHM